MSNFKENGNISGFNINNNSLFNSIQEINSIDLIYSKFDLSNDFDLEKCKYALYYVFGHKIKKKQILEALKENNREYIFNNSISLHEFKTVCNHFKKNSEFVSDHETIVNFYTHLIQNNEENTLNFYIFQTKIKEYLPFLNISYIQELFLTLDKDKDGVIRISDLEKYLY